MDDELIFSVRLVVVANVHDADNPPPHVHTPLPILSVRVAVPVPENSVVIVTFGLLVAKSSVQVQAPNVMLTTETTPAPFGQLADDAPQTTMVPEPLVPSNTTVSVPAIGT